MAGLVHKGGRKQEGGARLVPGLDAVRAGQTLAGKYRIEGLVGSGASGVTFAARNVVLRTKVSLKIFASYTDAQEELLQRRITKARAASRLQSVHVARILDIGVTEDGVPYVATESFEGSTLEVELEERGRIPVEEAARWALEACEGLAEAHAAGLVHGDLKPQNLFLAQPRTKRPPSSTAPGPSEDPRILKILDFGTTSPIEAMGDQSASAFFGSPAFLGPEQIQDPGAVDARADVWALGVLLYNLISGRLPFEAETLSGVIVAVVYDAPSLLTEAPYELARLVHRCLEKDPANRPQNVKELADALAPFATGGARLSDRVRVMLETPAAPRVDVSASGSMPPVSVSLAPDDALEEPLVMPLVKRRPASKPESSPQRPRSLARRGRTRVRNAAFGLISAVAVIVLVGSVARPSALTRFLSRANPADDDASRAQDTTQETTLTGATMQTAEVPPYVPVIAPATPKRSPSGDLVEPSISFGPSARQPTTETPLAVTPTPLATFEPPAPPLAIPPRAATRPQPLTPRGTRWTPPPGLPTSREALPPAPRTLPPPPSRSRNTPSLPSSRPDDNAPSKLLHDRK